MRKATDVFLLLLIALNVLDFFKFLPGDVDFAKKIISWTILGLLFYKIHFTWLFFGNKRHEKDRFFPNHIFDVGILLSFLILSIKDLISMSALLGEEMFVFKEIALWFVQNNSILQIGSFYLGGGLLLVLSFLLSFHSIQKTSLMGNLHINELWRGIRFLPIFLILLTFYLLVFDLLLQWLAIAVDSLIVMLGIAVYVYLLLRRHKKYSAESLLNKVGSFGEDFEEKFLGFFHNKKHITLGITGLLVLHLLTEIGNFLLPYTGINSSIYFQQLNLVPLVFDTLLGSFTNVMNIVGLILLAVLPAFIWYEIYSEKFIYLPKWLIGTVFAVVPVFIFTPVFKFIPITTGELIGVSINSITVIPSLYVVIASLILGLLAFSFSFFKNIKKAEYHLIIISSLSFLFYYMFQFYTSTVMYYRMTLEYLFGTGLYVIFGIIMLFFLIKVIFYVFGSIKFLIQIVRHHLL